MFDRKRYSPFMAVLAAGLFLAAVIASSYFLSQAGFAYQAGFNAGQSAVLQEGGTLPVYSVTPYGHHYGWFGFGLFGLFIKLLIILFIFRLVMRLLFFPRWGWRGPRRWRRFHGFGPWGYWYTERDNDEDEDKDTQAA